MGLGFGLGSGLGSGSDFRVRVRIRVPGLRTPSPTPSPPPGAARTAVGSRSSAPSPRTTTRSSAASSVCWALKIFSVPYSVQLATSFLAVTTHTSQCCQNSASAASCAHPLAHLRVMAFVKAMGTLTGKMMAAGAASVGAVGAYQWSQVRSPHPRTLSEPVPPC